MRRFPFIGLVCIAFFVSYLAASSADEGRSIRVVIKHAKHSPSSNPHPAPGLSGKTLRAGTPTADGLSFRPASFVGFPMPIVPGIVPPFKRISKCKPRIRKCKVPICPPPAPLCSPCILPMRLPGQWELSTQFFFARVGGTVKWPATTTTAVTNSEADFTGQLGIPAHTTFYEFTARYQFRPHWALHYSIMPFQREDSTTVGDPFRFGSWDFTTGSTVHTEWDFVYQRVGLIYQPIVTPCLIVSLYNYWLYNDQRLRVSGEVCNGQGSALDRGRHMVMSGIEVQKCIKTLPNGATFSCDNRFGIGYLDDTLILDIQTGLQLTIPLIPGKWGYAKGGYRYIKFEEDRSDLSLNTVMEGGFVEIGMIF